ncbi:MAG: nuclear transport factor 2 family protein [Myxococcota bacterium]
MTDHTEIRERERQLYRAFVNADRELLEDVFSDDFIYQHTTGRTLTRKEVIEMLTSAEVTIARADEPEIFVRDYRDTVVTFGAGVVEGMAGGNRFASPLRFLNVWRHVNGSWRLTNRNSQLL